jgi:hypothetical protein
MNRGQRKGCRVVVRTRGNQGVSGGIGESFDGFSVIDEGHTPPRGVGGLHTRRGSLA